MRAGWLESPTVARRGLDRETSVSRLVALVEDALDECGCESPERVVVAVPTYVEEDGRLLDCPSLPQLTGTPLAQLLR